MGAVLCGGNKSSFRKPAAGRQSTQPESGEEPSSVEPAIALTESTAEAQYEKVRVLCEEKERVLEARVELEKLLSSLCEKERLIVESRELIRRLRHKCQLIDQFVAELATDDWQHEGGRRINATASNERQLFMKYHKHGAATMRVNGWLNEPLLNVAAMVNEVDLHPLFSPFLTKAERLHSVQGCGNQGQVIVRLEYNLPPPLRRREVVFYGFFCDALGDPRIDGLLLVAESIKSDSFWGYNIPKNPKKIVPIELDLLGFILKPDNTGRSQLDLVCRCDMKLGPLVPWSVVNYLAKIVLKRTFDNIEKLSRNFHETPFADRIKQNPPFYEHFIQNTVLSNTQSAACFVSCADSADYRSILSD